jgi:hypothetical protein
LKCFPHSKDLMQIASALTDRIIDESAKAGPPSEKQLLSHAEQILKNYDQIAHSIFILRRSNI